MQYAFARTCGILRKVWDKKVCFKDLIESFFRNEKEKALAFFLGKFHKVLEISAKNYKIHHLARYIYELSQIFNSFYAENRVLDVKNENSKQIRIFLVQKTSKIIWKGLKILWIDVLKKM
jgi:arginyl-tRNA synthetase